MGLSRFVMAISVLFMCCGAILFLIGGVAIARGAAQLARVLGFAPLATGVVTIIAGGGVPELFLLVRAQALGGPELAVGAVFGSAVAFLTLVPGIAAVALRPLDCPLKVVVRDVGTLAAVTLLVIPLASGLVPPQVGGGLLLVAFAAYLWLVYRSDRRRPAHQSVMVAQAEAMAANRGGFSVGVFIVLLGMIAVMMAAHLVVSGTVVLARISGLPHTLLGGVLVALLLGLPQAVILWSTCRRSGYDIFFGQLVAAAVLNLTLVPGLLGLSGCLRFEGLSVPALCLQGIFCLVLAAMVAGRWRISRKQGYVLLGAYSIYLVTLAVWLNLLSYLPIHL